jgi:hypothetical protein
MGRERNVQRVLVRKPEGKRPLERRRYRDENIKVDFTEISWDFFGWIHLAREGNSKRLLGQW